MAPSYALGELRSVKYGIEEVRARRDPEAFVQKVILYGSSSGTATTVFAQLLLAHQLMDGRLRLNVPEPNESALLPSFINALTFFR